VPVISTLDIYAMVVNRIVRSSLTFAIAKACEPANRSAVASPAATRSKVSHGQNCLLAALRNDVSNAQQRWTDEVGPLYFAAAFGGVDASFWKRGSFRIGSNMGSSRRSAAVSGMFEARALS
jgi:hypothetical protein